MNAEKPRLEHLPVAMPEAVLVPVGEYAGKPPIRIPRLLTLVGSGLEAHVRLRSRSISRRHAVLLNVSGGIVVRDLGSRTGVFVNERPASQAVLADGDRLRMGKVDFQFRAGPRRPADHVEAPAARLRLQNGGVRSLVPPLFVIGRQRDCNLVFPEEVVARSHAAIFPAGGSWVIAHLPARSRTTVNGVDVGLAILRPGDQLDIEGHVLRFEVPAPGDRVELSDAASEAVGGGDDGARDPDDSAAGVMADSFLSGSSVGGLLHDSTSATAAFPPTVAALPSPSPNAFPKPRDSAPTSPSPAVNSTAADIVPSKPAPPATRRPAQSPAPPPALRASSPPAPQPAARPSSPPPPQPAPRVPPAPPAATPPVIPDWVRDAGAIAMAVAYSQLPPDPTPPPEPPPPPPTRPWRTFSLLTVAVAVLIALGLLAWRWSVDG